MTFTVAAALDRYVEANASVHPVDHLWHPSSISGCQRKAVYSVRGVEPTNPPGPKQLRVFFIGSRFHEMLQAAVKAEPGVAEVHTEVRILVPELNITGAADQLVIFVDGSAELQEFKSIKEWPFKKLEGPKDDHLEQVKSYLFALREYGGVSDDGTVIPPLGDRLSRVRFTYVEKQTLDTKEYVVQWDPAWATDLRSQLDGLELYRGDPDSLPPRLPTDAKGKRHWMCGGPGSSWGSCPFFDRCWNQDPDEVPPSADEW